MRLFASVQPTPAVLQHLATALTSVGISSGTETSDGPVRWTAPETWHLTLAFYGSVPDGVVGELEAGLAGVASNAQRLEIRLRGAGVFSRRTLWVGVTGDVERLVALGGAARAVGRDVTGRQDDRVRSRPHLTVGRVVADARSRRSDRARSGPAGPAWDGVAGTVRALAVYEGPSWWVRDLRLVSSKPGRGRGGGPLYTDVARFPLAAD